jgi:hypothetical protein
MTAIVPHGVTGEIARSRRAAGRELSDIA